MKEMKDKLQSLNSLIGNTPLLEIHFHYKNEPRVLFAKAEYYNLTGSIKDRMALYVLEQAYIRNEISQNDEIVEATSGNTGISFSAIGAILNHPVTIFMPEWMSEERKRLIMSYGANIKTVSKDEGGFVGSVSLTQKYAKQRGHVFLPDQFANKDNRDSHYHSTAPEIYFQMKDNNRFIDAFVAGVGTGGTITGISDYLKERYNDIKVFAVEPASSPTLSTGHKTGFHRIAGISDEFVPPLLDFSLIDDILAVDDGDAILMAQMLSRHLGLGVGISSGANFIGALMAQNRLGSTMSVVTIFSDDNKKYLSTDLMKVEAIKEHYLCKDVELKYVISHKRSCITCRKHVQLLDLSGK
ncbi:MAG: cysteine synthase [Firmicutes bacterium HGW-Firmicutes-20]|jgi:cysteine synthase|nr:MAG: cysteine synthase [Firmicutes bacterium HGW-Firmicutes-20]PKM67821.1 MAG: cysteine synthase [Firmicutes bacterium HGW-Firmicutes-19]